MRPGPYCGEGTGTLRLHDAQGAWHTRLRDALRRAAAGASLCALVGVLALVCNSAGKGAAEEDRGVAPSFSLELLQSQTPGFRVAGAGDTRASPSPGKVFAHDYVETMLRIQQLPHNCTGQSCCACGCCLHTPMCKTTGPLRCVHPSSPTNLVAPPLIPLSSPPPPSPRRRNRRALLSRRRSIHVLLHSVQRRARTPQKRHTGDSSGASSLQGCRAPLLRCGRTV